MPPRDFSLGDYVEVKDRIKLFYAAYPDGRLVTFDVHVSDDPDAKPRVWAGAKAYRTADDPHPAVGWSWLELPGTTPYTRGSEIENAETSAWGRAIGALGIGIDKSIASRNEVESKAAPQPPAPASPAPVRQTPPPPEPNEPPFIGQEELGAFVGASMPPATQRPQPQVGDNCPKHNAPWKGQPGDLFHGPKDERGQWCRPDGQPRRGR